MNEKSFVVIVDSMADFRIGYENPNLVIVETPVTIGGEDFTFETPDEFYARQKQVFSERDPRKRDPIKTAAPNVGRLIEEMRKILETGKDAIYVSTASTLSSAFMSGRTAVNIINEDEDYKNKAIVIDGLSMSALTALLVEQALKTCDTTQEFLYNIFSRRNDTEHFFSIYDWNAFRDSGRIPKPILRFANLMNYKPLMRFDFDQSGYRTAICEEKARDMSIILRKAVQRMKCTICPEDYVCKIIHACNPNDAAMLYSEIRSIMPDVEIDFEPKLDRMGNATGVHLGYSAVGFGFMRKTGIYENAEYHRIHQKIEESAYGYGKNFV